jgi:hypothetical protein
MADKLTATRINGGQRFPFRTLSLNQEKPKAKTICTLQMPEG